MKQNCMLCALFLSLLLVVSCGGKYADFKKVNSEYLELMEDYVAEMDTADDARSVARAMNRFNDGLEGLVPRMKIILMQYPELKKENLPEELRDTQTRTEEIIAKMAAASMKIAPYMQDEEVMAALERMGKLRMQQQ